MRTSQEICVQVIERIEIQNILESAVVRERRVTPRQVVKHLLWLEEARRQNGVGPDPLDHIQGAFWYLCPPEER